ncbi:MAG TPA: hypothetical protein VFG07_00715 [Thermoplasmata archaeon]|nr:hypothetical protein [Thermoplasmata archaeon]
MSPRKSSTSSGNPPSPRPRYLGLEVAGDLPINPRWVERELARLLRPGSDPGVPPSFRLVRWEGHRGLVEVGHREVGLARRVWNDTVPGPGGHPVAIVTRRTWGTLRKGKLWLRESRPSTAKSQPAPRGV